MKIEVLCSINSGEYDKGMTMSLPRNEALRLIMIGAAKKIPLRKKPTKKKEQLDGN